MTTDPIKQLQVLEQSEIDRLVAKDPLDLAKGEFETLLRLMRKKRRAQALKGKAPKKKAPKVKGEKPDLQSLQNQLNLKLGESK